MLTEELKSRVDTLSEQERHELSCYLTKLELQNNPDYWKTIRQRTNSERPPNWIQADKLSESQ
ncbi:MAG: hypothetical protein ACSHX9_00705 [Luteolibacter sp.]